MVVPYTRTAPSNLVKFSNIRCNPIRLFVPECGLRTQGSLRFTSHPPWLDSSECKSLKIEPWAGGLKFCLVFIDVFCYSNQHPIKKPKGKMILPWQRYSSFCPENTDPEFTKIPTTFGVGALSYVTTNLKHQLTISWLHLTVPDLTGPSACSRMCSRCPTCLGGEFPSVELFRWKSLAPLKLLGGDFKCSWIWWNMDGYMFASSIF